MRAKLAAFTTLTLMALALTVPSAPTPTVAAAQEGGDSTAA